MTEDAISRQATLEAYKVLKDTDTLCVALIRANIMQQPSVKQETILDKIRAEIDAHREKLKIMADDDWYAGKIRGYDCAIEIIDKYKAESENKK